MMVSPLRVCLLGSVLAASILIGCDDPTSGDDGGGDDGGVNRDASTDTSSDTRIEADASTDATREDSGGTDASFDASGPRPPGGDVPAYYLSDAPLQFIHWDYPALVHTGIDVDYKLTGYDWDNRPLRWSVDSGPDGMTVDADGTLHWTPDDEGSYPVTVSLQLGDDEVITKSFDVLVDDSRCIFLSPDGDASGSGTLEQPYEVWGEDVAGAINDLGDGPITVYHREGVYRPGPLEYYELSSPQMRALTTRDFSPETQLLIRNFPGESVTYEIDNAGLRSAGEYRVWYGMDVVGSPSATNGLALSGRSVGKRLRVRDVGGPRTNNVTGFVFSGSTLLDQCESRDNYDRTPGGDPDHHNNSNYLFFGTRAVAGHAYVIDSISEGQSIVGFKIKHAGDSSLLHIHRSLAYSTRTPVGLAQNRATVRHSTFVQPNGPAVAMSITDPTTGGENHTDEGMLFESNLMLGNGVSHANWAFASAPMTPAYFRGNIIEASSTGNGHIYTHGQNPRGDLDGVDFVFRDNWVYSAAPENAFLRDGSTLDLETLFERGEGNMALEAPGDYVIQVGGREFRIAAGVLTEL